MDNDEKLLVKLCKKYDAFALKELYEYYSPALLSICIRYTINEQEAA